MKRNGEKGQQANPGGTLAPYEIIGRDELIARLWKILESRSVLITAERRAGKTSIVRDKMGKEPQPGRALIYLDVSNAAMPLAFVETLLLACRERLDTKQNVKFAVWKRLKNVAGLEIGAGVTVKLPASLAPDWKELLTTLLQDIATHHPDLILAFDELPLMLDKMRRPENGGDLAVMEILDTLRAARQTHTNLRMIYTGSLGLHHILTPLRAVGYQNDPTNDMAHIDLSPLSDEYATELGRRLIVGGSMTCEDAEAVARHLAFVTNGLPYYIQHLADELARKSGIITTKSVDACLTARLDDLTDPWDLRYYDSRIDTHYPAELRPLARALLDQLAHAAAPLTQEELRDGIDPQKAIIHDKESVLQTLRLLGMDHYLITAETEDENAPPRYHFRFGFIARAWRRIRG